MVKKMYYNPYEDLYGGNWLKTNFHTHAGTGPNTCGSNPIETVLCEYKKAGYGALCISNHDQYTDTEPYDDGGMYLIQGVEYSQGPHMLTIGVNKSYHSLPHQEAINETVSNNGFVILCHPNWEKKEYWPWDKIDSLSGYAGIEILNMLIYRLSGSGRATDTWDHLLRQGKLAFGFGNDDMHILSDIGRSLTDIYVTGRGYAALKQAVDAGRFTVSSGMRLEYLTLNDDVINIRAKLPIETYIKRFTYRFITENGMAQEIYAETAEYTVTGENYIRVEVIAENGAMLFTQPVYRQDFFKKP